MTRSSQPGWPLLRTWLTVAERSAHATAARLDTLNVFPVPDADTGTNLHATLSAAADRARALPDDSAPDAAMRECGVAALRAARGNSGTLLAVTLAGMAEPLGPNSTVDAATLTACLASAERDAREALAAPCEGTLLSVLSAVASHAGQAVVEDAETGLVPLVESCVDVAHEAVRRTEQQLEPLRVAGVVDAGAVGLLWVLESLRAAVVADAVRTDLADDLHGFGPRERGADEATVVSEDADPGGAGVEVMCLLELSPLGAASLRQRLTEGAEAVILAPVTRSAGPESSGTWRVHFHVPDAQTGHALLSDAGPPQQLTVSDLSRSGPGTADAHVGCR